MTQEALKLALEALDSINSPLHVREIYKVGWAMKAIKEALAQPEQEPVAWPCLIAEADFSQDTVTLKMQCNDYKVSSGKHWLYTTPPQRTWVGLTWEEIDECFKITPDQYLPAQIYRRIEAKLKEKNT